MPVEPNGFNPELFPPDKVEQARKIYADLEAKHKSAEDPGLLYNVLRLFTGNFGGEG